MNDTLESAPALSTPDTHILEDDIPVILSKKESVASDEEITIRYEIVRTLAEIKQGRWHRIALQFPDDMLSDAPRVFELLSRGINHNALANSHSETHGTRSSNDSAHEEVVQKASELTLDTRKEGTKLYILADTSYGSCCVDEIAAEHINAGVVVHYGRACLSPTARLPVIHVFTRRKLLIPPLVEAFKKTFPDVNEKVILAADVTFSEHMPAVYNALIDLGYANLFATSIKHDPSSPIPNRTVPADGVEDPEVLKEWQLFHISDPPTALLLTLSSRVAAIHIYPTVSSGVDAAPEPLVASTTLALRRRYAILTSLNTVSLWGILVNTLSVSDYLDIICHVEQQIASAGKKSYKFVVGKLNAAKIANFSEIGGWVVVGCWESSLVESKDFYKPVITPFELELALQSDSERVWTGEWRSDFRAILDKVAQSGQKPVLLNGKESSEADDQSTADGEFDSEPESAPPQFDLRTGRYVSHTRPMKDPHSNVTDAPSGTGRTEGSTALTKKSNGDLASIRGSASPGAAFLQSNRTWKGLGSDFDVEDGESNRVEENGTAVTQGRSGIARGYVVGDGDQKH